MGRLIYLLMLRFANTARMRMHTRQQQSETRAGSPVGMILKAIAPWMLIATTLRTLGVLTLPDGMLLLTAAELALFIAFLLASQRWIETTGGDVGYAGLSVWRRLGMSKGILLRIAALGYAAYYCAWFLGLRSIYTTPVVYGFDAIAFNRFNDFTLIWGPTMALASYLLVVQQAMGRKPTLVGAAGLIKDHWRYLLPVTALLVPALALFNTAQWSVGPVIKAAFNPLGSPALTAAVTIIYLCLFASLRLAGTIAALTFALRASYRAKEARH